MNEIVDNIVEVVQKAKAKLATSVNSVMTETYWNIGKYIVEVEQNGKATSIYGSGLLTNLSHELSLRLGKGYSRPNLNNMRKFFLRYPNCRSVSENLSWSHICELISIDDDLERQFYENECIKEKWDVRTLKREKDAALFLRLASSKDKEGILSLANNGITYQTPEDVIKSTYTLDFLNISQMTMYSEDELEQKIIDNLQQFLMELAEMNVGT